MTARAIIAWQPLLTDHQSHTLDALAAATGNRIGVRVSRTNDAVRAAQGWTFAAPQHLDVELRDGSAPAAPGTVHLFGSPFEDLRQLAVMARMLRRRQPVFLIAEPYPAAADSYFDQPNWRDRLRAVLRPALYRAYGLMLAKRIAGVFAISPRAVAQFQQMGVPADRIWPFGYFVPSTDQPHPARLPEGPLRVVFIGALIERKGLAELVIAARQLRADRCAVVIHVHGPGDPQRFDFAGAGIFYHGPAAFGTAQAIFARYDLAVVPSRHDGWGVVVNEALQAGTPVVCSDGVGAHILVRMSGGGSITPAGDSVALADIIARLAGDRPQLEAMAAAAQRFAPQLEPAVAGRYLREAIDSTLTGTAAPDCPWYPPQ